MRVRVAAWGCALTCAATALAACGGSTSSGPGATPTATAPPSVDVTVTDSDNGKTIHVTKGTGVVVILMSTYWMIQGSSDGRVLHEDTAASPSPASGCVAGQGCGIVVATFTALKDGTATVTAMRTSCGEARNCTGGQGSFSVTIVVSG